MRCFATNDVKHDLLHCFTTQLLLLMLLSTAFHFSFYNNNNKLN